MSQDRIESAKRPTPSSIIKEGREWINTPYHHQAMVKCVGVDCVGFIVGVGLNTGALILTKQQIKEYAGYGRLPNPNKMGRVMRRYLNPLPNREPVVGDIAWLEWRAGLPMHLALVGELNGTATLLHALGDVGKVVEHTLSKQWEERIVSFWRYPELF